MSGSSVSNYLPRPCRMHRGYGSRMSVLLLLWEPQAPVACLHKAQLTTAATQVRPCVYGAIKHGQWQCNQIFNFNQFSAVLISSRAGIKYSTLNLHHYTQTKMTWHEYGLKRFWWSYRRWSGWSSGLPEHRRRRWIGPRKKKQQKERDLPKSSHKYHESVAFPAPVGKKSKCFSSL